MIISDRIDSLDWLRGLMAMSVMIYHLISWNNVYQDSSNLMSRLAIGGVSIFFILSGLCISIVYKNFALKTSTCIQFYLTRIFRIWPLLWAVTFLLILLQFLSVGEINYSFKDIVLNISTLFGFVKPSGTFITGAWSIGNEMVYYAFTPFVIYLYKCRLYLGNLFLLITLGISLYFAFFILNSQQNLDKQWEQYINPLNNFCLFVLGVAMYFNFNKIEINSKINLTLLVISLILFIYLPFKGDQINLVSGIGRIVFIILYFLIVFCFYKMKNRLPFYLNRLLYTIGLVTFGIYMLHPIVKGYTTFFIKLWFNSYNINHSHPLIIVFVCILTILISTLSYFYFEIRIIQIGKKITAKYF